ncbi:hypothetical protein [Burkholderia sp. JP2-270]|uniref:hypothetical protein n=1 Tax=Burkholderia sp. JP2-270 TaxID=2217913 RepID=UPI0013A6C495|nr:hypothetical protein [Burkholderia sp. JP2-270]
MTRHASFEKAKDLDMPFFSIIIAHRVTIVCCVMFVWGSMPVTGDTAKSGGNKVVTERFEERT